MNNLKNETRATALLIFASVISFLTFIYIVWKSSFNFNIYFQFNSIHTIIIFIWLLLTILLIFLFVLKLKLNILQSISTVIWQIILFSQLILTLLLIIFLLFSNNFQSHLGFTNSNTSKSPTASNQRLYPNVPNLQITVADYTKTVKTYCDVIYIKLDIKNLGDQPLTYDDLVNRKYQFEVRGQHTGYPVWMNLGGKIDPNHKIGNSSTIDDFGSIAPNEEKTIIIRSGLPHLVSQGEEKSFLENIFSSEIQSIGTNGETPFTIAFVQIVDDSHSPTLSESAPFIVSNTMFDEYGFPKACAYLKE